MYLEEDNMPEDPQHNELIVDRVGIVWRYDETEDEWIETFYSLDREERLTIVKIIEFYKSAIGQAPDDILDSDEWDRDTLDEALDYLLKKFGGEDER